MSEKFFYREVKNIEPNGSQETRRINLGNEYKQAVVPETPQAREK